MPEPLIELQNVSKSYTSYNDNIHVLENASLKINDFDLLLISAPSGFGKTTLLNLMTGLLIPNSGYVYLEGKDLATIGDEALMALRLVTFGQLFQDVNFISSFTLKENIEIVQDLVLSRTAQADLINFEELLNMVNLQGRGDDFPWQLSGGEYKRAALARAIAGSPRILILDEPTANLDRKNRDSLRQLILELKETLNLTIIIASHDEQFEDMAKSIISIQDKKITLLE